MEEIIFSIVNILIDVRKNKIISMTSKKVCQLNNNVFHMFRNSDITLLEEIKPVSSNQLLSNIITIHFLLILLSCLLGEVILIDSFI